jgi:hypothetical protein
MLRLEVSLAGHGGVILAHCLPELDAPTKKVGEFELKSNFNCNFFDLILTSNLASSPLPPEP